MWNRRKECILPRKLYFLPHLVQPTFAKTVNLIWSKSQTPAKRLSVHAYMEQRVELTSSPATQQVYVYSTGENQLSTDKRHTVEIRDIQWPWCCSHCLRVKLGKFYRMEVSASILLLHLSRQDFHGKTIQPALSQHCHHHFKVHGPNSQVLYQIKPLQE